MKICYICTGNACRSPFAEAVTKSLLEEAGIEGMEVFSLGTWTGAGIHATPP